MPKDRKPRIAKADIPVFKIIDKDNTSFIQKFQYEPNTLYRLRKALKPALHWPYEVDAGFHAYTIDCYETNKHLNSRTKKVKFTIPKGARYFIGIHGDIVATAIRSGDLTPITGKIFSEIITEPNTWYSMDSAPKDGSRIVVEDAFLGLMAVEWRTYVHHYPNSKPVYAWCVPDSDQDEQGGCTTADEPLCWMMPSRPYNFLKEK
jgi:hypothetical protein